MPNNRVEFFLGGVAACGAGLFTNPLEVVKTRMQIQGELLARGMYTVHYRNVFHAFYTIAKYDGIFALQKGLVPAIWYQFLMNGSRFGCFQVLVNEGWVLDSDGKPSGPRYVAAGAFAGCVGAAFGNPFYLVKTHLQNRATNDIAVGHQHRHTSMTQGLRRIFQREGILGLWRGIDGAAARVTVGSAVQLGTFSNVKHWVEKNKIFEKGSFFAAFTASILSGCVVVAIMTPFDVVSTRLFNQQVDPETKKGVLYRSVVDCFGKIMYKEGPLGFYKGWTASLFRLAPHTILSLMFWDRLREFYYKFADGH